MLHAKVRREELSKGISQAYSVANKRTTMPILSNVLISTQDDQLVLTVTDLEITFQGHYNAEIIENGLITIPAKIFNEVIKSIIGDVVEIRETDNHSMELSCGTFKTTLFGLSPENFPKVPLLDNMAYTTFESKDIIDAINKTIFAVATSDDTYNLSGVNLIKDIEDSEQFLRWVSTDAQRLNVCSMTCPDLSNFQPEGKVLISRKGLQELKNLADGSETIALAVSSNSFTAKTDNALLMARLLDGAYPDYKPIIPKDNDQTVWLDRKAFQDSLKRISLLTSDKYPVSKFAFTKDLLTITSMNPELGQAEESLGVEYNGEDIVTGFNPSFYIDVISAMRSEKISILLKAGNATYLLSGPEDPGYIAVLVSMSIYSE
jgi:DNA polymerase-3 subunit beta